MNSYLSASPTNKIARIQIQDRGHNHRVNGKGTSRYALGLPGHPYLLFWIFTFL